MDPIFDTIVHSAWIIQWNMVDVYDANIPDSNVIWPNVVQTSALPSRRLTNVSLNYIAVWGPQYPQYSHPQDVWIFRAYPWKYVGWIFDISLEIIARHRESLQSCQLTGTYSYAVWVKVSDNVKVIDWVKDCRLSKIWYFCLYIGKHRPT